MTMPIEATEQTGPVVIWRKELRPDSGGDGQYRGGLGQIIEIEPAEGHEFDFSAMFDRVNHPAKGRDGGGPGAPGRVAHGNVGKQVGFARGLQATAMLREQLPDLQEITAPAEENPSGLPAPTGAPRPRRRMV